MTTSSMVLELYWSLNQLIYYRKLTFMAIVDLFLNASGGSRIFRRGACTHLGGVDLQRGHFSVKMYAKTKELGPIGGRAPGTPPLDPPMNAILI